MEFGGCKLGIAYGKESELYSFPSGHPMSSRRVQLFVASIMELANETESIVIYPPKSASEVDLLLFHTNEFVDSVKQSSLSGEGFLDYGDTPSFRGVYEASLFPVGNTLMGLDKIMSGDVDHFFNPVGGLHHARRNRAGGFCVFNDASIAISKAINELGMKRIAYVDIDAHHGDGVYYGFESDPRVIIADIHEDGRYLYPGTGFSSEVGIGKAEGTKINIPVNPRANDKQFIAAFDKAETFIRKFEPDFILLQCGADGLDGDPITQLAYTAEAHRYAAWRLHIMAHEFSEGRILAMGGGGYNQLNVESAWMSVARELCVAPRSEKSVRRTH